MSKPWSKPFRYWVFTALILLIIALVMAMRSFMGTLIIAALLAYLMNPIVDWLDRRVKVPRGLATILVILVGIGLLAILPALMLPTLLNELQIIYSDLENTIEGLMDFLSRPVQFLRWEIELGQFMPDIPALLSRSITIFTNNALHVLESVTKNILLLLVIFATTFYLMRDWMRIRGRLFSIVPADYNADAERLFADIKKVWRGYLRGNFVLMIIVGIVFTLSWIAIGIPGALLLGITAGVLTIIPDLGPAIAAGLAVLVALIRGSTFIDISNFWFAVLVLGIYLGLINVKNIWLRPLIFGRSVHMHEGVVFVAIIAAVILQGILGAIIIVPVLGSAMILGRYIWRMVQGLPPWLEDAVAQVETETA